MPSALVHLGAGIGNIVLATPLLVALNELGIEVHLILDADYAETATLFDQWAVVKSVTNRSPRGVLPRGSFTYLIPAIPPFYWSRVRILYEGRRGVLKRPEPSAFYRNEQAFYLSFACQLGFPPDRGIAPFLPIGPMLPGEVDCLVSASTVVLAPGCKTGEMAMKRWPGFGELARRLPDVAVIGTPDDLLGPDNTSIVMPDHVRSYVGATPLRRTAELLATAGIVVGNDSGLSHMAAALGVPTVMIFGPTPDRELGPMPPHVRVVRAGLPCEPCWHGDRFGACSRNVDCLRQVPVDEVMRILDEWISVTQPEQW